MPVGVFLSVCKRITKTGVNPLEKKYGYNVWDGWFPTRVDFNETIKRARGPRTVAYQTRERLKIDFDPNPPVRFGTRVRASLCEFCKFNLPPAAAVYLKTTTTTTAGCPVRVNRLRRCRHLAVYARP